MGSAPHQGACADLNRGCTWACRRLRRACSCSVRVSSASCGVHCASTSNVVRRASTGTNVLGASACSLCRTCCDYNSWLRFSPCRVLRLHMHLSWGASRQRIQCLRRATQVLEYLASALLTYAAPFATATGGLNSIPVEPTVYTCTCGDIHCAGTSIARCTLPLMGYMRRHHQYPCTCACHGVHRAGISSVLRRASTGT